VGGVSIYWGSPKGPVPGPTLEGETLDGAQTFTAYAGDVDADGFGDLLACWRDSRMSAGGGRSPRCELRRGPTLAVAWKRTSAPRNVTDPGRGAGAGLGDFDADGRDDVALFTGETNGKQSAVDLVLGRGDALDATSRRWFVGAATDYLVLTGAGDLDGDGNADLAVGGTECKSLTCDGAGVVVVLLGTVGAKGEATLSFSSERAGDGFGVGIGALGDVDGNGLDDLIVGAPADSEKDARAGRLWLARTQLGAPPELTDFVAGSANDLLGVLVSGGGDVNGDGIGDFIAIGDFTEPTTSLGLLGTGASLSVETLAMAPTPGYVPTLAVVGDVDGDGLDDVALGSPAASDKRGEVEVVFGSRARPAARTLVLRGTGEERLGLSLPTAAP